MVAASEKSVSRRRPAAVRSARSRASPTTRPISSAHTSGSRLPTSTPAPPRVSGTAPAACATTGTEKAIASSRGTQKPSWSLAQAKTLAPA